jgi:hypothetical protein
MVLSTVMVSLTLLLFLYSSCAALIIPNFAQIARQGATWLPVSIIWLPLFILSHLHRGRANWLFARMPT